MQVKLAKRAGFCFGVRRAVDMAEELLVREKEKKKYCVGPLIHNDSVVKKLSRRGLEVVGSLDGIKGGILLIRSHGAGKELIARAKEKRMKIFDATCPFVKRMHEIATSLQKKGYRVLILGDKGHPEIEGLSEVANGLLVVGNAKGLDRLKLKNERVCLMAQTTQSAENYGSVLAKLSKMGLAELRAFNTICRDSIRRQKEAKKIAKNADVMIILGGRNSANTNRLAAICRESCRAVYHIETADDLKSEWFSVGAAVGVASGASTPDWIIEEVVEKLQPQKGRMKKRNAKLNSAFPEFQRFSGYERGE